MTSATAQGSARRETVALTRRQVETVLIEELGCDRVQAGNIWDLLVSLQQDGAR